MKRFLIIALLLLTLSILSSYSYAKRCKECMETAKKYGYWNEIGVAHRDFETPIVHKDGKAYATYKCCFGHVYLVDLSE